MTALCPRGRREGTGGVQLRRSTDTECNSVSIGVWSFLTILILAGLCPLAFSEVKVTQSADAVAVWTDATKLVAKLEDGRASGFDLADAKSGRILARIALGGSGGWRAACSAEAGVLTFTALDTKVTGGASAFDRDSQIRVELRDGDPFPLVSFRLKAASVGKEPLDFFLCRMESAQVFYRGGFEMPCPTLDPFPMTSASTGGWTFSVPMAACPVPAVGLWDATSTFVGYEFQDARGRDRSDKDIGSAYCAALPEGKGQFPPYGEARPAGGMALLMPPRGVESRFRLIYSSHVPPSASPNEFVLAHLWKTYRDRLAPSPAVNDLGWMPKREHFAPDDGTTNSLLRRVAKNALDEEGLLFTDGTLLATGGYRGVLNALKANDPARRDKLLQDWQVIQEKAVRKTFGADECVFWRYPLDGNSAERFGGEAAASFHNPSTWQIGAALLAMYRSTQDAALLPYLDGAFRWSRHCAFIRPERGLADATVEFFLNFYHAFKNDRDSKRRAMAEESLSLGRSMLYRSLAAFTADPDDTDALDPTFLIQASNDRHAFGLVSWEDTGKLLRAMALYAVETGDPVLEHFLRGALQRWPLGVESDGFHTIESLDVFGVGPDTKGRRLGLLGPDEALAECLQPVGSAKLRVVCGRKRAMAFTANAVADVRNYRFDEPGHVSFEVVSDSAEPLDVIVTAPLRDLRGKRITLNGQEARAEVVGVYGENAWVRGVRGGAATGTVALPCGDEGGFRLVALTADIPLDRSWRNGLSWAGLVEGLHFAHGVPFRILPGDNAAAALSNRPLTIQPAEPFASAFLFAAPSHTPLAATVTYADGKTEKRTLADRVPALAPGPMRGWQIDLLPLKLPRPARQMEITGDALVFAVTLHPSTSPKVEAAMGRWDEQRKRRKVAQQAEKERQSSHERMVPDLRAKVAAATRGKTVRIAFLPPHEGYTETLRAACCALGVPGALLSAEELVNPTQFNPEQYPIAVHTSLEVFIHTVKQPGDGAEALKRYVAGGGCLIVAAHGYPLYYGTGPSGERKDLVKGLRNGQTCVDLEIFIAGRAMPPLDELPRYELVSGQKMFAYLPGPLRNDLGMDGLYWPVTKEGLPAEDVFQPALALKDAAGKEHGIVAAVIDHECPRYKGGRVTFLWGNILRMEIGPVIALELMSHAICTAKLKPTAPREPRVAILPRDMAGHEKAIEHACAAIGLKTHALTPEEFADSAVFNPRNFPIAIHAVRGEYYLDECAGRSDLWQTYADYVRAGGFLVACGTVWQFYYAGRLTPDGKWQQRHDPELLILSELNLRVNTSRFADGRPMFLKCLPGQNLVRFKSPMPLEYLNHGRYRGVNLADPFEAELMPMAEVVDVNGGSFGGYAAALLRFTTQELRGAELLWLWGDLLDDPRGHPLLEQALRHAYQQRKTMFSSKP